MRKSAFNLKIVPSRENTWTVAFESYQCTELDWKLFQSPYCGYKFIATHANCEHEGSPSGNQMQQLTAIKALQRRHKIISEALILCWRIPRIHGIRNRQLTVTNIIDTIDVRIKDSLYVGTTKPLINFIEGRRNEYALMLYGVLFIIWHRHLYLQKPSNI